MLFVYGTLMSDERNHQLIAPWVQSVRRATAPGFRLFRVETDFPGAVPGEGNAAGELLELDPHTLADTLAVLDQYELYFGPADPRNEYDRRLVTVLTETGPVEAWMYVWTGVFDERTRVQDDDWRERPSK